MKKSYGKDIYMVVDLNGKSLTDDLEGCLKISCTNKSALSKATGIRYYRLVYVFKRQGRSYLYENGVVIFKSSVVYKGSQPGGFRKIIGRGMSIN
jgi:hypothetical protein